MKKLILLLIVLCFSIVTFGQELSQDKSVFKITVPVARYNGNIVAICGMDLGPYGSNSVASFFIKTKSLSKEDVEILIKEFDWKLEDKGFIYKTLIIGDRRIARLSGNNILIMQAETIEIKNIFKP